MHRFAINFSDFCSADYLVTAPLIVLDLMSQLRAPYTVSCAVR